MQRLSERKAQLDEWLAGEAAYAEANKAELQSRLKESGELEGRLAETENEWLELSAELERLRPRTRLVPKPYSLTMLVDSLTEMLLAARRPQS